VAGFLEDQQYVSLGWRRGRRAARNHAFSCLIVVNLVVVSDGSSHTFEIWPVSVIQQQQQHSILSQASWSRLEMKPKRDEKHGDT
jgi:hypothetical protein